jgi:hypothetical protein
MPFHTRTQKINPLPHARAVHTHICSRAVCKPAAALSIVVYTIGLPVSFLAILLRHRAAIFADQTLRMANEGATPETNPNFHIRRRYQELYRFVSRFSLSPPPLPLLFPYLSRLGSTQVPCTQALPFRACTHASGTLRPVLAS